MTRTVVHNFGVSLDGFGTGVGLSRDAPFGHAGTRLLSWLIETPTFRDMTGHEGHAHGSSSHLDDVFARRHEIGVGAEIMGAHKFGPPGWHEDPDWTGWWGEDPPFHTPVFVLTHHPRASLELAGGNVFHFVDASPQHALELAAEAAGGQDVRIGGGPSILRDFLAADLVDDMHVAVVPILLGRGVRLWDGLEGIEERFDIEQTRSASGVVHTTFTRRPR
ncbi:dihydrofolate reductase family protein [Microbacterium sp. G2-8]|uniref:dihydrofolate reductase family protein n=1 Tax=Microbacterium sp. G2-8 TaxID=2842454 RepID=UPI001C8AD00A|nr:dihydrofolate reductase family protein [Microbacterium sp. G2-8]